MHDLIREHARTLAARVDPDRDRDGTTGRLLDYYQHAAGQATQAAAFLGQALEIFQRTGAAEAGDVSRELAALTEAGPPA